MLCLDLCKHKTGSECVLSFLRPLVLFCVLQVQQLNSSSKFEEEIKAEQEERKKQAEEAKLRKQAFKEKQAAFGVQ